MDMIKVSERYLHTGGGCMVLEQQWLDTRTNAPLFVDVNEEVAVISTLSVLERDEADEQDVIYNPVDLTSLTYAKEHWLMFEDAIRSWVSIEAAIRQCAINDDDVWKQWNALIKR